MKTRKILSAALSITMIASAFGGISVNAADEGSSSSAQKWTKIYSEDFQSYPAKDYGDNGTVLELTNANAEVVNTDWTYYGSTYPGLTTAKTATDGSNTWLQRNASGQWTNCGFMLTGLAAVADDNKIEFDLASTSENKNNASASYARINMASSDHSSTTNSYYEVGIMGSETAVTKHQIPLADENGKPVTVTYTDPNGEVTTINYPANYKQITTVTDSNGNETSKTTAEGKCSADTREFKGTKSTDDSGNTTTVTYTFSYNGDYTARSYFVMYKNGAVEYIKWGDRSDTIGFNSNPAHMTVISKESGIEYTVANQDGTKTVLSGECADSSLMGTGTFFTFAAHGHETGTKLDNLNIYSAHDWQKWTADFSKNTEEDVKSVGSFIGDDFTVVTNDGYGYFKIADGVLKGWTEGGRVLEAKPTTYLTDNLSSSNTVETDIAETGGWDNSSAFALRTAVSGSTYYELGFSGSHDALSRRKLPYSGEDGVPVPTITVNGTAYNYAVTVTKTNTDDSTKETIIPKTDNCTFTDTDTETYSVNSGNYRYRQYFAKVVDGAVKYIKWENSPTGLFQYSAPNGDAIWRRWNQMSYSTTTIPHITMTTTETGVKWSFAPRSTAYTWTDSYVDAEPIAKKGAQVVLYSGGHEQSFAIKNFSITYDANEVGELPNYDDNFKHYSSDKVMTDSYNFADGKAVIAEDANGNKWVTSVVRTGNYKSNNAKFDNGISFWVAGAPWSNVLFDAGKGIKSIDKLEMLVQNRKRVNGLSTFISKDESTQIAVGIGGGESNNLGVYNFGTPGYTEPFIAIDGREGEMAIIQQPTITGTKFNNSENVKYTITKLDDKTIEWKAVGQATGAVSGGIITSDETKTTETEKTAALVYNANVESVINNAYYPMGLLNSGDGTSKTSLARAWYTIDENYEKPMFEDDFSLYRNDEATITQSDSETGVVKNENGTKTEGTYIGHRMESGPAVLATHSDTGAQWITSKVWTATYSHESTTNYLGAAYINTSADALQVKGVNYPHFAAVNLDMGADKKVTDLHKAVFTMKQPARNAGVRLFVSGNEKCYLEFGFTGAEASLYGSTDNTPNAPYSPMIRKAVNLGDTDGKGLTSAEANAATATFVYAYGAFAKDSEIITGVARDDADITTPKTSENSTVSTTGAWSSLDTSVTYTITVNADGSIDWIADGSGTGYSSGTINDEDVKALVNANWVYPAAFASGGDGDGTQLTEIALYGTTEDVSYATMYEKKAYTSSEFSAMYKEADYGRDEQVHALLSLDLSDVVENTAKAEVSVTNELTGAGEFAMGLHHEFHDAYDAYYGEDGELKPEYIKFAQSQPTIETVRFGGASSNSVNMWKDLNDEVSTYVSFPESIRYSEDADGNKVDKVGTELKRYKMGLVKTIKAFQANNPNVSFMLCVSPYTTTPEEIGKLVTALTGTDSASKALRKSKFGSDSPINIYAIELGNEIDYGKGMAERNDIIDWYLDFANEAIDAIEAANPAGNIKIVACGPTAPWGTDSDWGSMASAKKWVKAIATGRTEAESSDGKAHNRIADRIDALAFHPYYYGHTVEGTYIYSKPFYQILCDNGFSDVKLSMTEHAVNWVEANNYYSSQNTTGTFGALANAYFLTESANCGFVTSSYYHSSNGSSPMFSRWQYSNGTWMGNPTNKMFNVLDDVLNSSEAYKTSTTITEAYTDTYTGWATNRENCGTFSAATIKGDDDSTVNLIFVNNQGYTNVETKIDLPAEFEEYKLTKKTVFTAPNMYSFTFDEATSDLATATTEEYEIPEVFGDQAAYLIPNKSVVVLTLSGNASMLLKDEFAYGDTEAVYPTVGESGVEANTVVTNSNGTKWVTSAKKFGIDENESAFGSAKIENGKLVVSNVVNALYTMGVNWDVTGFSGIADLNNINEIKFTTTNSSATGGVMLFVKGDTESSSFDFSNELCGLSGTINWTVKISGEKLTWTAVSGTETKTGTMAITDADMTGFDYLAQVYVNSDAVGTVSLDSIDVSYGNTQEEETPETPTELITYEKGAENIAVTVNPSLAAKAFIVFAGYYNADNTLASVTEVGSYATTDASAIETIALPASGQTVKLFAWNSISGMKPVNKVIPVE